MGWNLLREALYKGFSCTAVVHYSHSGTQLATSGCRLAEVVGFEPTCHGFGGRRFPIEPHPKVPERYLESTQGVGLGSSRGVSNRMSTGSPLYSFRSFIRTQKPYNSILTRDLIINMTSAYARFSSPLCLGRLKSVNSKLHVIIAN